MRKLPHWCLTDKFPAFYDHESLTAIEQTARLYGAMQDLIDEYNKFVDSLNAEIENYEKGITEEISVFERGVNQKFDDFTKVVELMLNKHNLEVTETINYIKANISAAVSGILKEMRENGELSEIILTTLEGFTDVIEQFDTFMEETNSEIKRLDERITFEKNGMSELYRFLDEKYDEYKRKIDARYNEITEGFEDFKAETNEAVAEFDNQEKIKSILYPELTQDQKNAITSLAMDYYTNRGSFYYNDDDVTRNSFVGNNCFNVEKSRFKMNCSSFVQFIFMGRSVSDFVGKNGDTYSNDITKAFDFGYYFEFKNRPLCGLAKKDSNGEIIGYYGFRKPHEEEGNFLSSYSYNSYYNKKSTRLYKQSFRSYMDAGDIASELHRLGCEIPRSALQVGDIVFTTRPILNDDLNSEFAKHMFKNITHTLIVSKINEDGSAHFIDCTDAVDGETKAITYCGVGLADSYDQVRGVFNEENIVMCARHPIAFGYTSNVPEAIERI